MPEQGNKPLVVNHAPNACGSCVNAKDKTEIHGVFSCYCVQYGIIINHGKTNCRGHKDGNESVAD